MLRRHIRKQGQALVEFALASTLIFFLLAAAVDLGFIFFSLQGLHNAAQEGATYGSRWPIDQGGQRVVDEAEVRSRVRFEAGEQGRIGFVNLRDLNSNGLDDVDSNEQVNGNPLIEEYITIQTLADVDSNGIADNQPCGNLATSTVQCYLRVTVESDYDLVFALSPVFGDQIRLRTSYEIPMRDTAAEGGVPNPGQEPVFQQGPRD